MDIKAGLKLLDHKVDAHWTEEGTPNIETLQELMGAELDDKEVKKANKYTRKKDTQTEEEKEASAAAATSGAVTLQDGDNSGGDTSEDTEGKAGDNSDALPQSEEDILKEALAKTEQSILDNSRLISKAKKEIDLAVAEQVKLQLKLQKLKPGTTNQQEINRYIKSENERKEKAHNERQKVIGHLSSADFPSKSPLDAALNQRKAGRGQQRPVR